MVHCKNRWAPRIPFFPCKLRKLATKKLNRALSTIRPSLESMAQSKPPLSSSLFFLLLLLCATATTTNASLSYFSTYSTYKTLFSLSHSLLTRVSNLRASRGDIAGANRAKALAQKLERGVGLGFWKAAWSVGWDYIRNYAWRGVNYRDMYGVISDLNELAGYVGELTRPGSERERGAWIARNYDKILKVANSVLLRLLKVVRQSVLNYDVFFCVVLFCWFKCLTLEWQGALKEAVETVEKELVDGALLRDCLAVVANDLKGVIQIVKELASQYYSSAPDNYSDTEL